jgi:hypothetical protein
MSPERVAAWVAALEEPYDGELSPAAMHALQDAARKLIELATAAEAA